VTGVQTCALPIFARLALPAGLAFSRFPFPATVRESLRVSRALADHRLRQPERQALLPDAGRALKQERLRQPAGGDGACQPVSDPLMAVQGGDGHGGNLVCGGKWGRCAKRNTLCANLLAPFPGTCASINDYGEERYN